MGKLGLRYYSGLNKEHCDLLMALHRMQSPKVLEKILSNK